MTLLPLVNYLVIQLLVACALSSQMSSLMGRRVPYLLTVKEMNLLQSRVNQLNISPNNFKSFYQFTFQDNLIGYVQPSFISILKNKCSDLYQINTDSQLINFQLHVQQLSLHDKTTLLNDRHKQLHQEGLIRGWRNEFLPVSTSYRGDPIYLLERAMVPCFGVKAYGVHMNGFVRDPNTHEITHLWVGRRSRHKSTWPGMLDHVVAGGQPYGISLRDNIIKECKEEANIPYELASKAKAVSAVSYTGFDEFQNLKRDVLFCYDLQLPSDFIPTPNDDEVESFELHTMEWVLEKLIYESKDEYKPNCNLVLIDFILR